MFSRNSWDIPSNGGSKNLSFEALAYHESKDVIENSLRLMGKFWHRAGPISSVLYDDFRIDLPCVLIAKSAYQELLRKFDAWLAAPQPVNCTLVADPDQELVLEIANREGWSSSVHHPALTVYYAGAGCIIEVFFTVDQSCVAQARNGLCRVMETFCDR